MGKVKIKKDDKYRVLLTELLPFEAPMIFSNEGFYSIVTKRRHSNVLDRIKELSGAKYSIPFNFEIGKTSSGDSRTLSIIHPYYQLSFVELYEKYHSLMLHLCSRSNISLRRISKVAKFYYSPTFVMDEDPHKNPDVEIEPEVLDEETRYLKSYFTYKPLPLISRFYEHIEFRKLEQRFNYMTTFDISKCFYHIYTHSICWAVKDKSTAKMNAGLVSFENEFDNIMQRANYNETNGILVGPEISRIFAEIILQRIDMDSVETIDRLGCKYGVDYEVRRYVDDYFVFANDESCINKVKDAFQEKLSYYKLYINHSKNETTTSPFVSNIYVAKREINKHLVLFFEQFLTSKDEAGKKTQEISVIRKPYSVSQQFIKDFQCTAKQNNVTYDVISKEVVQFIKKKLFLILRNTNIKKEGKTFENLLIVLFDTLLYCYSLNINANTTFKVAQAIILLDKYFDAHKHNQIKHAIYSKISQEIDSIFINSQRKTKNKYICNTEVLNTLIALKKLGADYLLSEKRIVQLFQLDSKDDYYKLNYFQIITLLYYIDDNKGFANIRRGIEDAIIQKFSNKEDNFTKAELVLLFLDSICCPYLSEKTKKRIVGDVKYCKTGESVESVIQTISKHKNWFVDWSRDIDLERILKKKEWGSSY